MWVKKSTSSYYKNEFWWVLVSSRSTFALISIAYSLLSQQYTFSRSHFKHHEWGSLYLCCNAKPSLWNVSSLFESTHSSFFMTIVPSDPKSIQWSDIYVPVFDLKNTPCFFSFAVCNNFSTVYSFSKIYLIPDFNTWFSEYGPSFNSYDFLCNLWC